MLKKRIDTNLSKWQMQITSTATKERKKDDEKMCIVHGLHASGFRGCK